MPVNDKIRSPDYNDIKNKIDGIMGSGSGPNGYGQIINSTTVNESTRITIDDWGRLRNDIINAYRHIYGVAPVIALPVEGGTVRYSNTFTPDSGTIDAPVTQFDTYANNIIANKWTVHPSQSATQSAGSTSTTWPGVYGNFWTSRIQSTITVSWTNATQARYFFNSGGEIRISASRSGGSTNQQNTSWTSILSSAGTRAFGGNLPGTGTSPLDGTNFYKCTNSYQQWYSNSGSSPYGSNTYRINARTPGVTNNSTGTASSLEFLVEFIDNYVDPGQHPSNPVPDTIDAVDGTFTVSVSYLYATGVLNPVGVGNFVVQQPTVSLGVIAPA